MTFNKIFCIKLFRKYIYFELFMTISTWESVTVQYYAVILTFSEKMQKNEAEMNATFISKTSFKKPFLLFGLFSVHLSLKFSKKVVERHKKKIWKGNSIRVCNIQNHLLIFKNIWTSATIKVETFRISFTFLSKCFLGSFLANP